MDQRELEQLPARIEALEAEQQQLHVAVSAPGFYKETPDTIASWLARLEELKAELLEAYARWDDLDSQSAG